MQQPTTSPPFTPYFHMFVQDPTYIDSTRQQLTPENRKYLVWIRKGATSPAVGTAFKGRCVWYRSILHQCHARSEHLVDLHDVCYQWLTSLLLTGSETFSACNQPYQCLAELSPWPNCFVLMCLKSEMFVIIFSLCCRSLSPTDTIFHLTCLLSVSLSMKD